MEKISICLSVVAILISVATLWLTLLHKGTVRMTQPTQIYFGPDGGTTKSPKIYFRTLLYSTSKKGRLIENLYVSLRRSESQQNFNIWVYGSGDLNRGSGLYVGETGTVANHHFLLPKDIDVYDFKAGEYKLAIYARLIGDNNNKLLHTSSLLITEFEAEQLKNKKNGIYFDWGPDSNQYHSHIAVKPPIDFDEIEFLLKNCGLGG
jgi:hypothetical protein